MDPRAPVAEPTIQSALERFLRERSATLSPEELRLYRHVLFFLALCVNEYGHRNLGPEERDLCEKHRHRDEMDFFEIFGPEKLLAEIDFFCRRFLERDVHTSSRVLQRAPEIVEDLRSWLVETGLVSAESIEQEMRRALRRRGAAVRSRRLARRLEKHLLSVDPCALAPPDYVPEDHHLVIRTLPGKIWLRVYRSDAGEDIGPLLVPAEVARGLGTGSTLRCALGRVRGRWHMVALSEVSLRG